MDKRTRYMKAKTMLLQSGKDEMSLSEVKSMISMHLASTEKAITDIVHLMVNTGLMEEIEPLKFKIHI